MEPTLIGEIRAFSRFYTQIIGLVNDHILNSEYSLPEARILYELFHRPGLTASDLIRVLDMDKGYLSRILRRFEEKKLVCRVVSKVDKRVVALTLTVKGRKEFELLDRSSDEQVDRTFRNLTEEDGQALVGKMIEIRQIVSQNKIFP
jgi:DNA-binding MarR family transcriptional regulator